ncbi:hypothetical protein [Burkholderia multivorans]|uniref:hypothetical protein n=1 Tax=Burkholderia multivorans TaxID=87883 RepID=UPI000DAEF726|nr:hypothetical protein [Burkholderia multivorans]RAG65271.1 hypothetical protein DN490_11305 [Burkholderia multivorans]
MINTQIFAVIDFALFGISMLIAMVYGILKVKPQVTDLIQQIYHSYHFKHSIRKMKRDSKKAYAASKKRGAIALATLPTKETVDVTENGQTKKYIIDWSAVKNIDPDANKSFNSISFDQALYSLRTTRQKILTPEKQIVFPSTLILYSGYLATPPVVTEVKQ